MNSYNLNTRYNKYTIDGIVLQDEFTTNDQTLQCYHYTKETICYSTPEEVKECRGIFRQGDKIISKTFGYTEEIDVKDIENYVMPDLNLCRFFEAHEGACVRLYKWNNTWMVSTNRKIDAYRSKWGSPKSKSFGDMFMDALLHTLIDKVEFRHFNGVKSQDVFDYYCDNFLNPTYNYTFLVRNNEHNRIVCTAEKYPSLYHIGTFNEKFELCFDQNVLIPSPQEYIIDSIEIFKTTIKEMNPFELQGIIIYMPCNRQLKVMNSKYFELFNIRGNEPSINYRYLQLRNNKNDLETLKMLYPDNVCSFVQYEEYLERACEEIVSAGKKYLSHTFENDLPQEQYRIMRKCIDTIKDNKNDIKTIVTNTINNESATVLNKIIKNYIGDGKRNSMSSNASSK